MGVKGAYHKIIFSPVLPSTENAYGWDLFLKKMIENGDEAKNHTYLLTRLTLAFDGDMYIVYTLIVFYEDHEHQVKECRMPGVPKKLKTTCLQ